MFSRHVDPVLNTPTYRTHITQMLITNGAKARDMVSLEVAKLKAVLQMSALSMQWQRDLLAHKGDLASVELANTEPVASNNLGNTFGC